MYCITSGWLLSCTKAVSSLTATAWVLEWFAVWIPLEASGWAWKDPEDVAQQPWYSETVWIQLLGTLSWEANDCRRWYLHAIDVSTTKAMIIVV